MSPLGDLFCHRRSGAALSHSIWVCKRHQFAGLGMSPPHCGLSLRCENTVDCLWGVERSQAACSGLQNPFVTTTFNEIDPRRTPQSCAISVRLISHSEFCWLSLWGYSSELEWQAVLFSRKGQLCDCWLLCASCAETLLLNSHVLRGSVWLLHTECHNSTLLSFWRQRNNNTDSLQQKGQICAAVPCAACCRPFAVGHFAADHKKQPNWTVSVSLLLCTLWCCICVAGFGERQTLKLLIWLFGWLLTDIQNSSHELAAPEPSAALIHVIPSLLCVPDNSTSSTAVFSEFWITTNTTTSLTSKAMESTFPSSLLCCFEHICLLRCSEFQIGYCGGNSSTFCLRWCSEFWVGCCGTNSTFIWSGKFLDLTSMLHQCHTGSERCAHLQAWEFVLHLISACSHARHLNSESNFFEDLAGLAWPFLLSCQMTLQFCHATHFFDQTVVRPMHWCVCENCKHGDNEERERASSPCGHCSA